MTRARLRDLSLQVGTLPVGPHNAITDVAGVRVGHTTLIADEPLITRTGVTAILGGDYDYFEQGLFAGVHCFNGFGELMGTSWIDEVGLLTSPILLTSTYSIGAVRDAMLADPRCHGTRGRSHQPVVGETNDALLSDPAFRITPAHVTQAIASAAGGPVAEGAVGGGTGMVCFEFKAGIGTSSRVLATSFGAFTVGVLVQANFGSRHHLTVDGVPVGRQIGYDIADSVRRRTDGSIIIAVATDAPLLPSQCKRLAQRAVVGLGRAGGYGGNTSGDLIVAFSTGNRVPIAADEIASDIRMLPNNALTPFFRAVAEATEEAILNSMIAADTMQGRDGNVVHALPLDLLRRLVSSSQCRTEKE
ncbi:P1 family peptidase [Roseiterribacter gracilis]|uniref:D-aminopeptidase n=1 Tax=Roseiterribacter gracilis TaxID=2812848 RepID=A0A8S8XAI1_9PROT|nr:D-aminopeptidase [Rhodospirillales bacterium TMPK1]